MVIRKKHFVFLKTFTILFCFIYIENKFTLVSVNLVDFPVKMLRLILWSFS